MSIRIQCPGCRAQFRASDELAGKQAKCPKCSAVIQVGQPDQQQIARPAVSRNAPSSVARSEPPRDTPAVSRTWLSGKGALWCRRRWYVLAAGGVVLSLLLSLVLWDGWHKRQLPEERPGHSIASKSPPLDPPIERPRGSLAITSYPPRAHVFVLDPEAADWPLSEPDKSDLNKAAIAILRLFVEKPEECRTYLGTTPCFYGGPVKSAFLLVAMKPSEHSLQSSDAFDFYRDDALHDGRLKKEFRADETGSGFFAKLFKLGAWEPGEEKVGEEGLVVDIVAAWVRKGETTQFSPSSSRSSKLFSYNQQAFRELLERWDVRTDEVAPIENAFSQFGQAYYRTQCGEDQFIRAISVGGDVQLLVVGKPNDMPRKGAAPIAQTVYVYDKEHSDYLPYRRVVVSLVSDVQVPTDMLVVRTSRELVALGELHKAAIDGDVAVVKNLLAKGRAVNEKATKDTTPLHCAARHGHAAIARLLLSAGAKVDPIGAGRWTPLQISAQNSHLSIVRVLLEKGANVNAKNKEGAAPLLLAAEKGNVDIAQLLIAKGAEVDGKDSRGLTALHVAASQGHLGVVKLLLASGAKVNARSNKGTTPFALAKTCDHKEVADLLMASGADTNIAQVGEEALKKPSREIGLEILSDPRIFSAEDIEFCLKAQGALARFYGKDRKTGFSFPDILASRGSGRSPPLVRFGSVVQWYGQPSSSAPYSHKSGAKYTEHQYPPLVLYEGEDGKVHGFGVSTAVADSVLENVKAKLSKENINPRD